MNGRPIARVGIAALLVATAAAQDYAIDWFKVAGGGGTSSGGAFTLTGTIGQADAAPPVSGGAFVLSGGFWGGVVAVQAEGAPALVVARNQNGSVTVSWPSPSTGWSLQRSDALSEGGWGPAPETVADDGAQKSVTVVSTVGFKFYRLAR
jgi:hypothetical protein